MLQNIILVGVGSMLGGIARYLLADYVKHLIPSAFPLGTFIVNLLGCFIIGMLGGWLASTPFSTVHHRLFLVIGFCGSFTTFSAFSMDNLELLASKAYGLFALNASLSLFAGLLFTFIGYSLTHRS